MTSLTLAVERAVQKCPALQVVDAEHLHRTPILRVHQDLGNPHEALFVHGEPSVLPEESCPG